LFYPVLFVRPTVCLSGCHTFENANPLTFLYGFGLNQMMTRRYAWSEYFPVRRFLQELWPLTLRLFHNFLLWTQVLLHFKTDLDETWHKARCAWSDDFPVRRFFARVMSACLLSLNGGLLSDGLQWCVGGDISYVGYQTQISSFNCHYKVALLINVVQQ
jgi:hypothetical protein